MWWVPAGAQCGASGILECMPGKGGGIGVGWDFPEPLSLSGLGWDWKENLSLAWTEGPGTWARATHPQAQRASGWGTMQEGRARSTVRVRPEGRAPSPLQMSCCCPLCPPHPGSPLPRENSNFLRPRGPPTGTLLPTAHSLEELFLVSLVSCSHVVGPGTSSAPGGSQVAAMCDLGQVSSL